MGVFLTSTYKYKDRYIITAGTKLEGNSKYSKESRWGFFPSVALAWRISKENFLKDVEFINDLKIRGSWGITGNSPDQNYLYYNTYSAGSSYSYLDIQGIKPNGIELTSLRWETVSQYNLGFDFNGISDRLNVDFDFYKKTTSNLYLKDSDIPSANGFSSVSINNGEMENRGLEFSAEYKVIDTKDLKFSVNMNISRNMNVVLRLPENYSLEYGDMLANGIIRSALNQASPWVDFLVTNTKGCINRRMMPL